MLCEKCGINDATMHIRSIVDGVIKEKHLCASCAVSEGYGNIKGNNLSQILSSVFDDSSTLAIKNKVVRCNCCGSTFNDIANSGKCGCAECYDVFYEQLLPYLKRVHGNTRHIGKTPQSVLEPNVNVEELRNLLTQLVKQEKYEEAAIVRDKIKALKGEKQ